MDHAQEFAVERMCKVLGVSNSGYYNWLKQGNTKSARQSNLEQAIKDEYTNSRCTYGSPRIAIELKEKAYKCSKSTVARYMNRMCISAKRTRKFKVTTNSNHKYRVFDNFLNREFNVSQIGKVWVSDITYIRVDNYWMYLTVVIDLADRMVVGWSLSSEMSAASTTIKAFKNAKLFRQPRTDFMFHSDRGVQYACDDFTQLIKDNSGVQSMSRKGNCWDNAVAESFFKSLKVECIYKYKIMNKRQAYSLVFDYIDGWYNTKRLHSALNNISPLQAFIHIIKNYKLAA